MGLPKSCFGLSDESMSENRGSPTKAERMNDSATRASYHLDLFHKNVKVYRATNKSYLPYASPSTPPSHSFWRLFPKTLWPVLERRVRGCRPGADSLEHLEATLQAVRRAVNEALEAVAESRLKQRAWVGRLTAGAEQAGPSHS